MLTDWHRRFLIYAWHHSFRASVGFALFCALLCSITIGLVGVVVSFLFGVPLFLAVMSNERRRYGTVEKLDEVYRGKSERLGGPRSPRDLLIFGGIIAGVLVFDYLYRAIVR